MARAGKQDRVLPRAATLVKLARRQRAVPAAPARPEPAHEHQQASATRARVDFLDPLMRHAAMQAKGVGLCAFLVTLAAYQRGLKVTFHYERASSDPRYARAAVQGHRAELFSISDGRRSHAFSRTMGDRTDSAANAIAEDKHLTKRVFAQAGVACQDGIVVERGQTALIEKFVARKPGLRFVVKPVAGSMGRDVHTDLPAERVLAAARTIRDQRIVVEEFIQGPEYRALVVDGRCIAVIIRVKPNVTGDGASTVRTLIERKNAQRKRNPRLSSNLIADLDAVVAHLARAGMTLDTVPAEGLLVELLPVASISRGGDPVDVTSSAPPVVAQAAVAACAAVGLGVAGVDLVVAGQGADARAFVLEVNQRPHIGSHSFPMDGYGQGNAVAEAIVDYYFPDSVSRPVQAGLVYDFAAVAMAMVSAQVAEVTLPVVGADWKVMRCHLAGASAQALLDLYRTAARAAGVHLMSAPLVQGGAVLCLAAAPANLQRFKMLLPARLRAPLEGDDVHD